MKKFIALGVALAMLLFSFLPTATVAEVKDGISVCSDIEPDTQPHN